MHEHSFIEAILKNIENPENLKFVKLEVGELAGIEPEHLKEHLREKINCEIEVGGKESFIECSCGYKGRVKILQRLHDLVIFECPNCGKIPENVLGKDIRIVKVVYN